MAGLTHTSALILQAIAAGYRYGFDVMAATGLPSGTVYPALRRLERSRLVRSSWEQPSSAHKQQRPARRYYEITQVGRRSLADAVQRFSYLERAIPPNLSGAES